MKKIISLLAVFLLIFTLTGCSPKEDTIQRNLLRDTGNFKTYRKITVINVRSDKILMDFEGYLTSKLDSEGDLNIMIMVGVDEYRLHYVRLAPEITYLSEQINNTHTDPYHWKINVYAILPDVEVN